VPLSTQGSLSILASWEVEEEYNPLEDELRGYGVLRVHVHWASSLIAAEDTTGDGKADSADPYCRVALADWKQQTAHLDQTLDPKWDERLEFRGFDEIYGGRWSLSDLLSTPLELAIFDEDTSNLFFGHKHELGTATVDLAPLRKARETTVLVPLSTQGDVSLTLSWEVEEAYVEADAEQYALEAKDVVLWEAVGVIRERLHARGFDADKERVAAMIKGRDFIRRRFALEAAAFGSLPEIVIKVKGQLQHVGLDATAEVIALALGEAGSASYHVGKCAKYLIGEIERELELGLDATEGAATKGRRYGTSRLSSKVAHGRSRLINRLRNAKASSVDMASLAVSINILFKLIAFEVTAFLQVNSDIAASMPELTWPKAFDDISATVRLLRVRFRVGIRVRVRVRVKGNPNHDLDQVSSVVNLDFVTEHGDATCTLGNNYCYRVMMMMLGILGFQLAFPACVALIKYGDPERKRVTQERLNVLVDRCYHGNAIVLMILHPTVSKKLASILACRYYNDTYVVQAAKTLSCGDPICVVTGVFFFLLYTVGIPVYVWYSLRQFASPQAIVRLGKSPMLARYRARMGFICGKFERDFWYYELLEMTRKTLLMAVAAFIQQGGFLAIFAKIFVSGFFFAILFRSSPFNSDKVDMLVTTSQLCTLATLFFALMMKIGFFEEEGVPKDVMGQILIYIMFLPAG